MRTQLPLRRSNEVNHEDLEKELERLKEANKNLQQINTLAEELRVTHKEKIEKLQRKLTKSTKKPPSTSEETHLPCEKESKRKTEEMATLIEANEKLKKKLDKMKEWKAHAKRLQKVVTEKDEELEKFREELRSAASEENENKKFIVVNFNSYGAKDIYAKDNVEFLHYNETNDLNQLRLDPLLYRKEMFVFAYNGLLNPHTQNHHYCVEYANLLVICEQWKKMRPDGELHVLTYTEGYDYVYDLSSEMKPLVTSFSNTFTEVLNWGTTFSAAINIHLPRHSDRLLSEKVKNKLFQ